MVSQIRPLSSGFRARRFAEPAQLCRHFL